MSHTDLAAPRPPVPWSKAAARRMREAGAGFLYWLVFVLVLEPGNILNALRHGRALAWDQEVIRITGAGLLGATITPLVLILARRFPIVGPARWRHGAIHLAGWIGLALTLIVESCVLASWVLAGADRPLALELRDQVTANGLLLVYGIAGFTALAHARGFAAGATSPGPVAYLATIQVKSRGGLVLLDVGEVDWIESQGNYLALHAGAAVHLIRETSTRLEAQLDPERFARIHRRTIIAVDRVRSIAPGANGDGSVRLTDGTELRLSRGFRALLTARLTRAADG